MKQRSNSLKTGMDIYVEQLKWSVWFIVILFIIHAFIGTISVRSDSELNNFFEFSYSSSSIYMLVIGIVGGYLFLPFYVKHGITRKDYYLGNIMGAIGLSVTITAIFAVIMGIETVIFRSLGFEFTAEGILPNLSSNLFLMFFLYVLNIFTYYLIGWLINVGYYRFKGWIGTGFVIISILAFVLHGFLWFNGMFSFSKESFFVGFTGNPFYISLIGTFIIIGALLFLIRLITKRIAVSV